MEHCVISIPTVSITTYEILHFFTYIPQCTPLGTRAPCTSQDGEDESDKLMNDDRIIHLTSCCRCCYQEMTTNVSKDPE